MWKTASRSLTFVLGGLQTAHVAGPSGPNDINAAAAAAAAATYLQRIKNNEKKLGLI